MTKSNQNIIIGIIVIVIAIAVANYSGLFVSVPFSNQCTLAPCAEGYSEVNVSCDDSTGICIKNCEKVIAPTCGVYSAYESVVSMTMPNSTNSVNLRRPTLTWTLTPGAVWYKLWINKDGVKYLNTSWFNTPNWTSPTNLPAGTYDYWVSHYITGVGASEWSSAYRFSVPASLPGETNLLPSTDYWTPDYEFLEGYCYKTKAYSQWIINGMETNSKSLNVLVTDSSGTYTKSQTTSETSATLEIYSPERTIINQHLWQRAAGAVVDSGVTTYLNSVLTTKLFASKAVYSGETLTSQNTCTYTLCTPNWQTSDWTTCVGGTQTRTVTDANSCGDNTGKPIDTQTCTVACSPDWQTTEWAPATCPITELQTRTVTDANSCGLTAGMPLTTQSCNYVCVPSWSTGSWTNCFGGTQSRSVIDTKSCGVDTGKPSETQTCTCTPNWITSEWGACTENMLFGWRQTRTSVDSNNCGVDTGKPSESQSCTPIVECVPDWQTSAWSPMLCPITELQTRIVTDANSCGVTTGMPMALQPCVYVCNPNWYTGEWDNCNSGTQSRSVTDLANCNVLTGKPVTSQSCTVVCTPSWNTGTWSSCILGTQSRSVTDSNNCNVLTNKPVETQSCSLTCTPSWQSGTWTACSNGTQSRTVTDSNNCGITQDKPLTTQVCSVSTSTSTNTTTIITQATCTPNWQTSPWANCASGTQTRTIQDLNNCAGGLSISAPSTSQTCSVGILGIDKVYWIIGIAIAGLLLWGARKRR